MKKRLQIILIIVFFSFSGTWAEYVYGLTVTGGVFYDINGNGTHEAGEPGLGGVAVSDGMEVAVTSKKGEYRLETEPGCLVFVSLPKGYRVSEKFYARIEKACEVNFAMQKWDESARESFRFVQITDIHIGEEEHHVSTFIEDIGEINSSYPKPAFVLATGDVVKNGENRSEYENYVRGISYFEIPVFNLPGNHDLHGGSLPNYQHFMGPDYYSFNVGSCHFILLNSRFIDERQKSWIAKDVAVLPKGTSLIFAFHDLPSPGESKFLGDYKASAVFTGHWHGSRVCKKYGVWDINTPPLRFGGIDRSPRGFRLVRIKNGKLIDHEMRFGGFKHHTEIVTPQGMVNLNGKVIPVVVNAYDTRFDIQSIQCEIDGHSFFLKQTSLWSWRGENPFPDHFSGEHKLTIGIEGTDGERWQKEASFSVVDDEELKAPVTLNWVSSTSGIIGFPSPVFGEDCIAIGVDDKGDLLNSGVSAFTKAGKRLWHYHTDSAVKNSVAAADGCIYAASVAGWLYALDEKSGELLWKADLDSEIQDRWEIAATAVGGGMVFAGAHSCVAAFDASDGKLIWKIRQNKDDWKPTGYPVPVFVKDKLVITGRTSVCVLDAQTGQPGWRKEGVFYGCKVVNDTIFTIHDGSLVALSLSTGQQIWAGREKPGGTPSSPAVAFGKLVVGTSDGKVCAFSEKDGSFLWMAQTGETVTSTQPYERYGGEVNSSPAILDRSVYIGSGDGKIHIYSLNDGKELGSYNLGVPVVSSPFISGKNLYIGAYDGNLYSFSIN